ncbi:hypothetical protein ACP70R_020924 [Stipagrostis hirtigluma subsp. patula]
MWWFYRKGPSGFSGASRRSPPVSTAAAWSPSSQ